MIKLLGNPYVLIGVAIFWALSVGGSYMKGRSDGYDKRDYELMQAKEKAENQAAGEIEKTKKEAQIVYKYIREQDNTCDIYDNVIERLPGPSSSE